MHEIMADQQLRLRAQIPRRREHRIFGRGETETQNGRHLRHRIARVERGVTDFLRLLERDHRRGDHTNVHAVARNHALIRGAVDAGDEQTDLMSRKLQSFRQREEGPDIAVAAPRLHAYFHPPSALAFSKVQFHAVAGVILEKDLALPGQRHIVAFVSDVQPLQVRLEFGKVRARECDVIEGVDHAGGTLLMRSRLAQMKHRLRPDIQPVAEAVERWPVAGLQTDDRHVEITQGVERRAVRAQVVVIESADWHNLKHPYSALGINLRCPAIADRLPAPASLGWARPSLTGTSAKSKGLMPSRQATLTPYCCGFERR